MLRVNVNLVTATMQETEVLTSGRVGLQCGFTFSEEWDGLVKVATFEGAETADVAILTSDNIVIVPAECLSSPGAKLRVGACGMNADGDIVIPTIWVNAGRIQQGAEPSGIPASEPSPNWAAQVQEAAASALEIARGVKAEADNGEFDGEAGVSPTATVVRGDSSVTVTITDANGTTSAEVYDGQTGATGGTGPAGSSTWVADTEPYLIAFDEHGITNAYFTVSELKGKTGDTVKAGDTVVHAGYMENGVFHGEYNGVYYVILINTYDNVTVAECDYKGQIIGPKGDTGNTGTAATVSIGNTTTLLPGSYATVTNSGTTSAAVFNFGIPKGDKGDTGDSGVYYGTTTPTDPDVTVWIDPSGASNVPEPATATPQALGTAAVGTSTKYAREDHVHQEPTYSASDVGAVASNQGSGNAGKFLVVGSDGIVAPVTMAEWSGGSY